MSPQQKLNNYLITINQFFTIGLTCYAYRMIEMEIQDSLNGYDEITFLVGIWEILKIAGIWAVMFFFCVMGVFAKPQIFPVSNRDALYTSFLRLIFIPVSTVYSDLTLADAVFIQCALEVITGAIATSMSTLIRFHEQKITDKQIYGLSILAIPGLFAFLIPVMDGMKSLAATEFCLVLGGTLFMVISDSRILVKQILLSNREFLEDKLHPWRKEWGERLKTSEFEATKVMLMFAGLLLFVVFSFFYGCLYILAIILKMLGIEFQQLPSSPLINEDWL